MKGLTSKHYMLIAGFLAATATVMGGLHGWEDLGQPQVIAGFLGQVSTLILSVFVDKPAPPA